MDVRRHVTSGRLSELFGEPTLETDKFVRTMGWRRVAEQELALIEPETRERAPGVRRRRQRLPAQPRARPRSRWSTPCCAPAVSTTPRRTGRRPTRWPGSRRWPGTCGATWTTRSAGCWPRSTTPPAEVARALPAATPTSGTSRSSAGRGRRRRLRPGRHRAAAAAGRPGRRTGRARGAPWPRSARALARLPRAARPGHGIGSNSWVVDGEHSATGAPLLANDPHLGVSLPGIWVQMGLHCRTVSEDCPLDVAGLHLLRGARA